MTTYLVMYDLINHKDYNRLIEQIKTYPKWARPLESVWLIVCEQTSAEVRDHLMKFTDSDDKLLVIKSGNYGAWKGITSTVSDWMKNNL
ncbi:MAG: hypothetical protein ACRCXO_20660 [Kluyvera intermedia]